MVKRKQSTQNTPLLEEEDRISSLPDCLLIDIITRLPETEEAIRTGTLSKRWQHLWPQVPNLIFKPEIMLDQFYSSIERITSLLNHLNKFHLHASYTNQDKSQLNNCICNAINLNVQEVDLYLTLYPYLIHGKGFLLPECFFISSSLIHLTLSECAFQQAGIISWKNLKTLRITYGCLDEDLIANILSGCPLLETLVLCCCDGFDRIDITNKSVKNLALLGCSDTYSNDMVEVNAPYILSLAFIDLLSRELVLLNVSSVIKAEIDYSENLPYEHDDTHEQMLQRLILSLGHVKELELTVGESCSEALACLQAKGFIYPSNLKVLQKIDSN